MCWHLKHIEDDTKWPPFHRRHFQVWIKSLWISINITLKFVPKGPTNNILALVQILAWRWPGDKALSESMVVNLPTLICVIWLQWVNDLVAGCKMISILHTFKQIHTNIGLFALMFAPQMITQTRFNPYFYTIWYIWFLCYLDQK